MKIPKMGDKYYCIEFGICHEKIGNEYFLKIAKKDYKDGNYFKIQKEAKLMLCKMVALLKHEADKKEKGGKVNLYDIRNQSKKELVEMVISYMRANERLEQMIKDMRKHKKKGRNK